MCLHALKTYVLHITFEHVLKSQALVSSGLSGLNLKAMSGVQLARLGVGFRVQGSGFFGSGFRVQRLVQKGNGSYCRISSLGGAA